MNSKYLAAAISQGNAIAMVARMTFAHEQSAPVRERQCGNHDSLRASFIVFEAGTDRLPHRPDEESYMDDGESGSLWLRNCRICQSTICFHLRAKRSGGRRARRVKKARAA